MDGEKNVDCFSLPVGPVHRGYKCMEIGLCFVHPLGDSILKEGNYHTAPEKVFPLPQLPRALLSISDLLKTP